MSIVGAFPGLMRSTNSMAKAGIHRTNSIIGHRTNSILVEQWSTHQSWLPFQTTRPDTLTNYLHGPCWEIGKTLECYGRGFGSSERLKTWVNLGRHLQCRQQTCWRSIKISIWRLILCAKSVLKRIQPQKFTMKQQCKRDGSRFTLLADNVGGR